MASVARVLRLHFASSLTDALTALDQLEELDIALSHMENTVSQHFASVEVPTAEISSALEAARKARIGNQAARQTLLKLKSLVAQGLALPKDLKALERATKMVEKFTRHEVAADHVLKMLSKRNLPPMLKEGAKTIEKLIRQRLQDQSSLQVLYTIEETNYVPMRDAWGAFKMGSGISYVVIFRTVTPEGHNSYCGVGVNEFPTGLPGLFHTNWDKPSSPQEFAEEVIENLKKRNPGDLKAAPTTKSLPSSKADELAAIGGIRSAMYGAANKCGGSIREEAYDPKYPKHLDIGFRLENLDSLDDYEQSEERAAVRKKCLPVFQSALERYSALIKSTELGYDEKGWWTFSVTLK